MKQEGIPKQWVISTSDPAVSAKLQYPRKDKRENLWKNLNVLVYILSKSKNLSMANISKSIKYFEKSL